VSVPYIIAVCRTIIAVCRDTYRHHRRACNIQMCPCHPVLHELLQEGSGSTRAPLPALADAPEVVLGVCGGVWECGCGSVRV
jgi:hypothetical protein